MGVPHEPKTFFRHLLAQPSERGKELEQSVSADMAAALKRRREPEQRLSADIAAVHAGPGQCREGQQQLLAGRQEQCIRRKTVHGRVEDQLDADYMTLCPPKRGQIRKLKVSSPFPENCCSFLSKLRYRCWGCALAFARTSFRAYRIPQCVCDM